MKPQGNSIRVTSPKKKNIVKRYKETQNPISMIKNLKNEENLDEIREYINKEISKNEESNNESLTLLRDHLSNIEERIQSIRSKEEREEPNTAGPTADTGREVNPTADHIADTGREENSTDDTSSDTGSEVNPTDDHIADTGREENSTDDTSSDTGSEENSTDDTSSDTGSEENSTDDTSSDTGREENSTDDTSSDTGREENSTDDTSSDTGREKIINTLSISIILGIISGIYSQTIQALMFGKVWVGAGILFGYSAPIVGIIAASIIFALAVSFVVFNIIVIAEKAENKSFLENFISNDTYKKIMSALAFIITCISITPYATALQIALFKTVLLGGSLITNFAFALIAAAVISALLHVAISNLENFKVFSMLIAFVTTTWFAMPILKALFGITMAGSALVTLANSLTAGLVATVFANFLNDAGESVINKGHGFALAMYATSFIAMSMYTTAIQTALLSNGLIFISPLLSTIVVITVASFVSAILLTALYKLSEKGFTNLMGKDLSLDKSNDDTVRSKYQFSSKNDANNGTHRAANTWDHGASSTTGDNSPKRTEDIQSTKT